MNKCIILIPFKYERRRECGLRTVLATLKKVDIERLVGCWGPDQEKVREICGEYDTPMVLLEVSDYIECFNNLVSRCNHDIVCFHCADCVVAAQDYYNALDVVIKEDCIMHPFTSPYIMIPTDYRVTTEIDYLSSADKVVLDRIPAGGIFFIRRDTFIKVGMLNENIKVWGPDDTCLYHQASLFNVPSKNGEGPLYHINHLPQMVSLSQEVQNNNRRELNKVKLMSRPEFEVYMSTWDWRNSCISSLLDVG